MWRTRITDVLKIKYPIVQGPFGGGYSSIELAATVSNLGGMGSFGAHHLTAREILDTDSQMRKATKHPYNINLWIKNDKLDRTFDEKGYTKLKEIFKPYFDELCIPLPAFPAVEDGAKYENQIEAILKAAPPVFSFVFGIPDKAVLKECRRLGIKTLGAATTVEEALVLEEADVDMITATGFEAGGHRVSFLRDAEESLTGTFSLIPQVADNVKIPVLAAGGIADGRGIAAALALGADGVQIGTAFLACEESNAPPLHRDKIFSNGSGKTVLTKAFTGRLARGTKSVIADEMKIKSGDLAPYPLQGIFLRPLRKAAIEQKKEELISFWAGQSASILKYKNVLALFSGLIEETEALWMRHSDSV